MTNEIDDRGVPLPPRPWEYSDRLVRAMAVWALRRLGHAEAVEGEAAARLARETDAAVRAEWQAAP